MLKNYTRVVLFCIYFLAWNNVYAQEGDIFLQNYKIPLSNIDNQNLAIVQGNNGIMYFANTKGILTYDGVAWGVIATRTTPYSFAKDSQNGRIYVGCRDNFGYIRYNRFGQEEYVSITEPSKAFGQIKQIVIAQNHVYFYSERALIKVNRTTLKTEEVWYPPVAGTKFTGFLLHKDTPYLNLPDQGLHRMQGKQFVLVEEGDYFKYLELKPFCNYDKDNIMFGANNDWHYLFDGKEFSLFFLVAEEYLKGNILNFSMDVNENSFITALVTGGAIMVEKKTGKTQKIINYQTGLPDDEVFAMCIDREGGLWLTHDKGITRADLKLPVRTFSSYAGIDGNVTSVAHLGDTTFVSTSQGVFYLVKVNRFEEVEGYIKKEAKFLKTVETVTRIVQITEPKEKNNIRTYTHSVEGHKDLKRKIKTKESSLLEEVPTRVISTTEKAIQHRSTAEGRKAYALESIPFIYKQVDNINGKCKQMVTFRDRVLVAANTGLYEVVAGKGGFVGNTLIQDTYIHYIIVSRIQSNRIYVGTNKGIYFLEFVNGAWKQTDQLKNLDENVYSILEYQGGLWLGAENKAVAIKLKPDGKFAEYQMYDFPESYSENIAVRLINNKITFFLSNGVFIFDFQNKKLVKDPEFQKYYHSKARLIFSQDAFTWSNATGNWQNISQTTNNYASKMAFFSLFDEVQEIHIDKKGYIWVVNNGHLHRIDANAQIDLREKFNIFIRTVKNKQGILLPLQDLVLDYGDNALSFTFQIAAPFFRNEFATEYQYWLEGLNDKKKYEWSSWERQAIISFPFLPSGEYKFHVRAKNIFGQPSQEQVFTFKINPPFWETTWFYALQSAFFALLMALSIALSRIAKTKLTSRIAYVISMVTIITMFEFLFLVFEPYVEAFTGGISFFKLGMNIILAISLAPLELLFRRIIMRREPIKGEILVKAKDAQGPPQQKEGAG
ncbi:MAG: hypothetical protein EAZ55_07305 [Cytophagales bacterium]|nr:MAG: hypothetical protein EAZ55_07305 [Cytophagales bacterium]